MENASKALLIAGGILMAMLTVSLLLFAWGKFSDFYKKDDDLDIKNITEFNLQFTGYDRDDVYGYELLSLTNKVADYNTRYSTATGSKSSEAYSPIELTIIMNPTYVKNKLAWRDNTKIFLNQKYITSGIDKGFQDIINNMTTLENKYGKQNLQNLCKAIDGIFEGSGGSPITDINDKKNAVLKFNNITTNNSNILDIYESIKEDYKNGYVEQAYSKINSNGFAEASKKYYEFTQFKKAKFKSDSSYIQYDQDTGRIKQMKFEFTGEVE